ncbi:MAG: CapA family protein [Myxococcota bacterium]
MTIALGGDVALPTGPNDVALDALGPAVFAHLEPLLAPADLAFANLEAPLTARAPVVVKTFPLASPPARLAWIVAAGLDLFSLANNHMGDAGRAGVADTLAALEAARAAQRDEALWWAGAATDPAHAADGVVFTPPGKSLRVALLALGNGQAREVAHYDDRAATLARVRALAARSDILIVSIHGGTEYRHEPDLALTSLAHAVVDAGASLVVMTHPHVVRGLERRGQALIFHGLGNLAFATLTDRHRDHGATLWGMLPVVTFSDGHIAGVRITPLWVDNGYPLELGPDGLAPAPAAAFAPYPLTGEHAAQALDFFERLSQAISANSLTPLQWIRKGDVAEIVF